MNLRVGVYIRVLFQFMKILLIIVFFYADTVYSQPNKVNPPKESSKKELIPDFKNNAEQEEYYVKKMFKEEYKKQNFNKFPGKINIVNNSSFQFDSLIMNVFFTSTDLKTIFFRGLLYPGLFGKEDSLKITDFQELKYVNDRPHHKRFSFWLFRKWLANPQVYYIELTNDKATPATGIREFINGARLTYFRPGGFII